jgi:AraC-like DNA-binding protein
MELVTARAAIAARQAPSWLREVVDYTEAHHHEAISLMQIAQVAGLSRSNFSRQFRERTGSTYHRFLVEVRVERAKQALLSGADVTAAAHEAGFSDASHLIRTFRSKTGMTPSTWRAGAEHGQHVGENIAEQPDR